jgi:lipoate-protein ligase B
MASRFVLDGIDCCTWDLFVHVSLDLQEYIRTLNQELVITISHYDIYWIPRKSLITDSSGIWAKRHFNLP